MKKELIILLGNAYREARKRGHQLFTVADMRKAGLRGEIPWQRKIGHLRYDNHCKLCGHRFSIEPKPFGKFHFSGLAARQLCRA